MRYRTWLLSLLILTYACAFVDRVIVAAIGPALIREFHLSDVQFALLGGLAFALLFSTFGVPVARLAERASRVRIISVSVAVWSLMTALFGTARSLPELLLYRLGVGLGEAGVVPAAHSLLSDTYPSHRRASAIAVFSVGAPIGAIVGGMAGGWLAQAYGWRVAMLLVGFPGVLIGLLVYVTLREPARGALDPPGTTAATPPFREVLSSVAGSVAIRHATMGAVLATVAATGINLFGPTYLVRQFGVRLADAGLWFGLVTGVSGALGIVIGGFVSDRAGRRGVRWYALVPALGAALACPLYVLAFHRATVAGTLMWLFAGAVCLTMYFGPTFALAHNLTTARMRASVSAIVLLCMNVVGQGIGPLLMGVASDYFAAQAFGGGDYRAICPGVDVWSAVAETCARASALGLQRSIVVTSGLLAWSALHFWRAERALAGGDAPLANGMS